MSADLDIYDRPHDAGTDYILDVRIRNGPLLRALRMRGFKTPKAFCAATGFCYSTILKYLGLRRAPIGRQTGDWKPAALALAKHLRLPPDSLFPEQHLEHALSRSRGEIEMSREDLCLMLAAQQDEPCDPEADLEREQVHGRLLELMQGLTPREQQVLGGRFGFEAGQGKTLEEISSELKVGKERVRQIEAKALRKLKCRRCHLQAAGGYGFI